MRYEQENVGGSYTKNLKAKIDAAVNDKQLQVRIWEMCVHYLEGRQHLIWNKSLRSFDVDRRPVATNKVTINLLLNIYRNISSRLAIAYPGIVVLPASPSSDDVVKAKSSEVALQYYWNEQELSQVFKEAVEWLVVTGNAFLHTYYDPDKQSVMTKSVSPYDVFYEAGVSSSEEAQFCSIRHFYLKKDLIKAYPDKKEQIETAIEVEQTPQGQETTYDGPRQPANRVVVYETYFKDTGKYCIHVGDEVLFEGKTPNGVLPVQHIKYTDLPNRLWGMGLLLPLVELQSLYNRARTQIIQNVELMGNPKWLIPKTSGVNPNAITNRPGEKVFFNPAGGVPQQIPAIPIPAHVIDNVQQIHSEMLDVSGVHSISLGKRAKGISSGKAMNALAAQDSSQLHTTQHNIVHAAKQMAETALIFMKSYYSEPKMVRMLDTMGKVVFDAIKAERIVDDPEIFIEAGTMFRNEAQDKDQKILELLQAGLIPPEMALKELSFRTGNSFVLEKMADEAHAQEILGAAMEGNDIEIFNTDNLRVFKDTFGDFMRTSAYYSLPMERQDYIRDVYVAIEAGLDPNKQPFEQYSKVYPPQPARASGELMENVVMLDSARGQEQVLKEKFEEKIKQNRVQAGENVMGAMAGEPRGIETSLQGGE